MYRRKAHGKRDGVRSLCRDRRTFVALVGSPVDGLALDALNLPRARPVVCVSTFHPAVACSLKVKGPIYKKRYLASAARPGQALPGRLENIGGFVQVVGAQRERKGLEYFSNGHMHGNGRVRVCGPHARRCVEPTWVRISCGCREAVPPRDSTSSNSTCTTPRLHTHAHNCNTQVLPHTHTHTRTSIPFHDAPRRDRHQAGLQGRAHPPQAEHPEEPLRGQP